MKQHSCQSFVIHATLQNCLTTRNLSLYMILSPNFYFRLLIIFLSYSCFAYDLPFFLYCPQNHMIILFNHRKNEMVKIVFGCCIFDSFFILIYVLGFSFLVKFHRKRPCIDAVESWMYKFVSACDQSGISYIQGIFPLSCQYPDT